MLLPEVAFSLVVWDVQLSQNFAVKGDVSAMLSTEICAVSACLCEQWQRTPAEDAGAGTGDLQMRRKHPAAQLGLSWQHL